jgi:lysine decarboxylase
MTLFLRNGSTVGNHIVSMAFAKRKVLIQTNSHLSVYNGLLIAGATIVTVQTIYDPEFDIFMPIQADQVKQALEKDPDISGVFITSPSYEGLVCNYEDIKRVCKDVLLVVDEAHGAWHYFSKKMPTPALLSGVDVAVTSAYKTLGCLSSACLVYVNKSASPEFCQRIKDCYFLFNTTAPNPFMLASVESAIQVFIDKGEDIIG